MIYPSLPRRTFSRGFSIVSTLVALSVGGGLAALTVVLVSRVIGAQRAVLDRDEVSEFSLFIKNVISADVTCGNVLRGRSFKVGGAVDVELPLGFGGEAGPIRGAGPEREAFVLPGGLVRVEHLRLRDKGVKPVKFSIPVANAEGAVETVVVDRYLAQLELDLAQSDGDHYRPRFVEVPVLVNARGEIESCNNQLNLGDVCQAMGLKLDPSTEPPSCLPAHSCFVGGTFAFTTRNGSHTACAKANPITNACACPEGFADEGLGLTGLTGGCGKFGCVYDYTEVHQCYRCP